MTPNNLQQPRLQDRLPLNLFPAPKPVRDYGDEELYAGLYKDWRIDIYDMRDWAGLSASRIGRFDPNVVKDMIRAVNHLSFHELDFLFWTTLPMAGLRHVWRYLTGWNDWTSKRYPYLCLQQIVPYDVFTFWLQVHLNGQRWRRPGTRWGLYEPIYEDYQPLFDDGGLVVEMVVPSDNGTITMPLIEYCDRVFLGYGGVFNDLKPLDLQKGIVLQYEGTLFSGKDEQKVLTPPIEWGAQRYFTQLTHGMILPYFYPKIMEGWLQNAESYTDSKIHSS